MWLLPSWGRAKMASKAIDDCHRMKMTSPAVLFVDGPGGDDSFYKSMRLPPNWRKIISPSRVRLSAQMQWALGEYPSETHYGWLADDYRPQTPYFDQELEDSAGPWGYAQANDLIITKHERAALPSALTSGLCWGGELVRAVGWWGWPAVTHVGIDGLWAMIIAKLGVCHYRRDVIVEHRRYTTGKRPKDCYDVTVKDDDPVVIADLVAWKKIRNDREEKAINAIVERVHTARRAAYEARYAARKV